MKIKFTVLLILYSLNYVITLAQVENADSLFAQLRERAAEGKYQEALGQVNLLRSKYPQNTDYTLYAARLYYWLGNYNEGYELTNSILAYAENANEEAFKLRASISLAAKKYEDLLSQSDKGAQWYPNDIIFYQLQKAQALDKLQRDSAAIDLLDSIPRNSEEYDDAQYLKSGILQKRIHTISLGYLYTGFSNPHFDPWHIAHIQYMAKTAKCAYAGRLNFGALFGKTALQGEFDTYPKVSPKSYMYLNTGFSDGSTFPLFRLGAEYYTDFSPFNISLGFRYLYFKTTEVVLFTGHFALNIDALKISYRPYLVPQGNKWYHSHIVNLRQSFGHKEAYIQLDLQYGGVPYYYFSSNEFTRTSAYRVGIDTRFRLSNHVFLQPILMYELEEYLPGSARNRYNMQVILSKRF